MFTFSLDEFGDFEGLRPEKQEPVFIAGLIFDDKNSAKETRNEKNRIAAYYRKVIETAKNNPDSIGYADDFVYPDALHSNGNRSRDHYVVRPVKEQVKKSIQEFIRKGTWQGENLQTFYNNEYHTIPARTGRYYLFVIMKSKSGMTKLLGEYVNELANDRFASNLYFHMASELVSRLLFHNPMIENVDDVNLLIATRSSGGVDRDSSLAAAYKKLGYKPNEEEGNTGRVYFSLTNADVYRTVIAQEMINSGKQKLKVSDFRVKSICYKADSWNQEFLYLADTINSVLSYDLKGESEDEWLREICERADDMAGDHANLVFGYDAVDVSYAAARKHLEEGEYYEALSICFDNQKKEGAFADLYNQVWFPKIAETIIADPDPERFIAIVQKVQASLRGNKLDQEKCFYIIEILLKMLPQVERNIQSPERKSYLYHMYDCVVSAYSHIGDSIKAYDYLEMCKKYAHLVGVDEYLATRNKAAGAMCDMFDFTRAKTIAESNVGYQELLSDMKKEIEEFRGNSEFDSDYGKSLSQLAQIYAFERNEKAVEIFREALKHFVPDSANYKITQSYLLHFYLDNGQKEEYLEESVSYFGGNTKLAEQLDYLLQVGSESDPLIHVKYGLLVYVRGIYCFRMNELNSASWKKLQNAEALFGRKSGKPDWKYGGHPAELFFKYMRLIAHAKKDWELELEYTQRLKDCMGYSGATIEAIRRFTEIQYMKMCDVEFWKQEAIEMDAMMKNEFSAYRDSVTAETAEEMFEELSSRLTYMYC